MKNTQSDFAALTAILAFALFWVIALMLLLAALWWVFTGAYFV